MKIVLGDDLCGQEQEYRKWACEVFKTSCEVFCLDLNDISMSLKSETLTKENTRFQPVKDAKTSLSSLLSKYHNKTVHACRVKSKPMNLHGDSSSERSTVLVEIIIDSVSLLLSRHTFLIATWKKGNEKLFSLSLVGLSVVGKVKSFCIIFTHSN